MRQHKHYRHTKQLSNHLSDSERDERTSDDQRRVFAQARGLLVRCDDDDDDDDGERNDRWKFVWLFYRIVGRHRIFDVNNTTKIV
jgi:hypothetical protein